MARVRKKQQEAVDSDALIVTYARLSREDYEVLKRREEETGAPMARQIRILVHEALRAQKARVIR